MDLIWHIPGEAQDRIIRADLDAAPSIAVGPICDRALQAPPPGHRPGLQAVSYILARVASFLRENVKGKGPALLFSGGALGLAIQAAWDSDGPGPLFVAVPSAAQGEKARSLGNGIVLEESDPGFIDRLKVETRGNGFRTVLVASTKGEIIRKALGVTGVLGCVSLLLPPEASLRVDLHSTVNHKSLTIHGGDVFSGSSALADEELQVAGMAMSSRRPGTALDSLFYPPEDQGADWFEIR